MTVKISEEMLKREPYIDAVIGPQSYHDIPKILKNLDKNTKKFNLTDFDVIEKFDKLNYRLNELHAQGFLHFEMSGTKVVYGMTAISKT